MRHVVEILGAMVMIAFHAALVALVVYSIRLQYGVRIAAAARAVRRPLAMIGIVAAIIAAGATMTFGFAIETGWPKPIALADDAGSVRLLDLIGRETPVPAEVGRIEVGAVSCDAYRCRVPVTVFVRPAPVAIAALQ